MKNSKIKLLVLLYTLAMLGSATKINAMENNKINQINLNKSTEQKQKNKSFDKKLNDLNLFYLKKNKNLKNKSFDKKIGELKLNNTKKNEETLNIRKNLEEFEIKFSNYLKELIQLEKQLLFNNENSSNFYIKKNLKQIKNNYEKQKQKIEKTSNEYTIFLDINSNVISQDKNELLYENLKDKISKIINEIELKIKQIDKNLLSNPKFNFKESTNEKEKEKKIKNKEFKNDEKLIILEKQLKEIENIKEPAIVANKLKEISKQLNEFNAKFSQYSEKLTLLITHLDTIVFNNSNDSYNLEKKYLEKMKKDYRKQKEEIEKAKNNYNVFLNVILKNKRKPHFKNLINEISKNIIEIENKIKNIDTMLNDIEKNNEKSYNVYSSDFYNSYNNENFKNKTFDKKLNQNKTMNKIIENLNLNNEQSSNSYKSSSVENLDSDIKIDKEEKQFIIKKLLDEINVKFVNYYTIYNYLYKFIKILKNSVNTTQNLFIDYINSILTEPIEKIIKLKTKYEENSNEIKELIKSFDEFKEIFFKNLDAKINFTAKMLNGDEEKIKNFLINIEGIKYLILKIDKIVSNFLMFDTESEKYVYYNFLKRSNQKNYGRNNPDINIAKLNKEFDDNVLNSKAKNDVITNTFSTSDILSILDILNMPIKSNVTNIAENEINLMDQNKKFDNNVLNSIVENNINFNTFSIFDVLNMPIKSDVIKIAEDEIDLMNQNEKIINSNLNNKSNQEDTNDLSQNYFNKKFIEKYSKEISTQYENSFKSFINLLKDIKDPKKYEDFHKQNRDLVFYYRKNNNRINSNIEKNFINTINNSENMVQKAIIQHIKIFEAKLNLELKTAIDNFFNLENKIKENIKNNEEKIISENDWNEFIKNWDNIKYICYNLKNLNFDFNEYFKNLEEVEKTKEKIDELALILTSIGPKPFVNLLINKLNSNQKTFDSLLFQTQLNAYRSKLENLFSYYIHKLIEIFKSKEWKTNPIEHCNKYKKIIKNFYKTFNDFLDNHLEKHIQKMEQNNIEIYEKESLKEKINCFKNIIKQTNDILDQTDAFIYNELNKCNINDRLIINFNEIIQHSLHDDVAKNIINKIKSNLKLVRDIISNKKDIKNIEKK